MSLPDDVYKNMKRMFPDTDIRKPIDISKTVPKRTFSKTLKPFGVENAIALKEFDEIKKGDSCQVVLMPHGEVYLGYFGQHGSGTAYEIDVIEGIDFDFKP